MLFSRRAFRHAGYSGYRDTFTNHFIDDSFHENEKKKTDGRGHKSVSGMEIMNSKDSCAMIIPEFEGNKVKEDVK